MKRIQKIMSVLLTAAMLVLIPGANVLKADAAEPVTYAVKYRLDKGDWYYLPTTSVFDESKTSGPVSVLRGLLKDGDLVVVYDDVENANKLDLGNVKLSNLTYVQNATWTMVYAGGVKDCYVLGGATGTINCDVENAYVYDTVVFNFNGNVDNLTICSQDKVLSSIGCQGTVKHLYAYSTTSNRVNYDLYDFGAGVLYFENGKFLPHTELGGYKTSQGQSAVAAPSQSTQAPATVSAVDSSVLASAKAGENVNVSVGLNFSIPVATQKKIASQKATLACQVSGTGYTLTLSCYDIKKPREDMVFQVTNQADIPETARNEVTNGSLKSITVNIGEKKFFSQALNLHVALGAESAGKVATMYSYDEITGKMRYEDSYAVNDKGQAVFRLLRGDEYVIVVTQRAPAVQSGSAVQAPANATTYVVARGDSLSKIAAQHRISLGTLLQANPQIKNANKIYPGDVLAIPAR